MDKDKLLAYFQTHYLSRQEVLYKLPLNYSIETFWPELLNRRKASAVVLPLYNSAGMPYWYVLTDKMIAASERLCEEALGREGEFDPYRTQMTGAMTEEMFFTSFVEGAQIPLQEAMEFLQRGTEPENIQEQMIWNNRRAWAEMTATLYRPLDESFIRNLAYLLTEEMDGCAEDYRQEDQHVIAAMDNEPYEVPPSYVLPERMRQYSVFLSNTEIHPLIKAAAAQAYLLVARPFPEGNERLSRMISSAVLLRCGYDFFRDISISSVIAKESYRYYRAMKEIIRTENGGDMTYFIEYFLELLVRSVDARKERLLRREREALERERELAGTPLSQKEDDGQMVFLSPEEDEERDNEEPSSGECGIETEADEKQFWDWIDSSERSEKLYWKKAGRFLRKLVNEGKRTFTKADLMDLAGLTDYQAKTVCLSMRQKHLATNEAGRGRNGMYRISAIPDASPKDDMPPGEETWRMPSDEIVMKLKRMKNSPTDKDRRIGQFLLGLIENRKEIFTSAEWRQAFHIARSTIDSDIRRAFNKGLIQKETLHDDGKHYVYKLSRHVKKGARTEDLTLSQKQILSKIYDVYQEKRFLVEECANKLGYQPGTLSFHINNFVERELLSQEINVGKPNVFSLLVTPRTHPECFPEEAATSGLGSYLGSSMPMAAMAG